MSYQLATAKVWNGSAWVAAIGGGGDWKQASKGVSDNQVTSTTMTSGGTAHTKGAWAQVVASTSAASYRMLFNVGSTFTNGASTQGLMDIGVGASGSEVAIFQNLPIGYTQGVGYDIPIYVPSGSRVAIRWQSVVTSKNVTVTSTLYGDASTPSTLPSSSWTTYGANTSTSLGVAVTPANGAKGSWFEITSSTSSAIKAFTLGLQCNGSNAVQGATHLVDIGTGAAGSETVIASNISISTNNVEWLGWTTFIKTFFIAIPSGTRIAIRDQSAGTTSGYQLDAVLLGITEVGK